MSNLSPEKALIFRITHVSNVPWILANGLHCSNSNQSDPNYLQIGNAELIDRRATRAVPVTPGGTLSDYVPFYFTPYSPMLYNIKTGYNGITKRSMDEIAILVASLREVQKQGIPFVFTDRHAYLQTAEFYNNLDRLDRIDWGKIQARDFRRDPDDPGKVERYQAEALVYRRLPVTGIMGIIHHCEQERRKTEASCGNLNLSMQVLCKPGWYL
jgi:ssDNA thymidine ADP-ribosyltransferase DarT-like protein